MKIQIIIFLLIIILILSTCLIVLSTTFFNIQKIKGGGELDENIKKFINATYSAVINQNLNFFKSNRDKQRRLLGTLDAFLTEDFFKKMITIGSDGDTDIDITKLSDKIKILIIDELKNKINTETEKLDPTINISKNLNEILFDIYENLKTLGIKNLISVNNSIGPVQGIYLKTPRTKTPRTKKPIDTIPSIEAALNIETTEKELKAAYIDKYKYLVSERDIIQKSYDMLLIQHEQLINNLSKFNQKITDAFRDTGGFTNHDALTKFLDYQGHYFKYKDMVTSNLESVREWNDAKMQLLGMHSKDDSIVELTAKLLENKETIDKINEQHEIAMDEMRGKINALREQNSDLGHANFQLKLKDSTSESERISSLESENAYLKIKNINLDIDNKQLTKELTERTSELHKNYTTLEIINSRLHRDNRELDEQRANLSRDNTKLQLDNSKLRLKNGELETKNEELAIDLNHKDNLLSICNKEKLQAENAIIKKLESNIEENKKQLSNLNTLYHKQSIINVKLESDNKDAKAYNKELEQYIGKSNRELRELRELEHYTSILKFKNEQLDIKLNNISMENGTLNALLRHEKSKNSILNTQLSKQNAQLSEQNTQLSEQNAKLRELQAEPKYTKEPKGLFLTDADISRIKDINRAIGTSIESN